QVDANTYLMSRALQMGTATNMAQAQAIATGIRQQQLQGGAFFTVNPSIAYDTRDRPIDPTKGTVARLTASPSLGLTGASFAKLGASFSHFIPVTKNTTFAFNLQGGTSIGTMPQFAAYRLGGWNGLDGYRQFTDLGTGAGLLMANAEYRFPIPFVPQDGVAGK